MPSSLYTFNSTFTLKLGAALANIIGLTQFYFLEYISADAIAPPAFPLTLAPPTIKTSPFNNRASA